MVAGLVSSCLLLMSSVKIAIRGSLSNHALQLFCVCLVLLACRTLKLPTSIVKSTNKVLNFCQRTDKIISHEHFFQFFIHQSRNANVKDITILQMREDKDLSKNKKHLHLHGKATDFPAAHVDTPAGR